MAQRKPAAVAEAARRAAELHEQAYGPIKDELPQTPAGPEPGDTSQTSQDAADEAPLEPEEGAASEPSKDTAKNPPKEPSQESSVDWEKRYKTLQGKYDAEVPRMAQELRQARSTAASLQQQIDELKNSVQATQKPAEPAEPAAGNQATKTVVTQEDIDDYGEDLIALIRRVAGGEVESRVAHLKPQLEKIERIEGQVTKTQKKTATEKVYALLTQEIKNWKQINKDPDFLRWLDETDPYTGAPRNDLLARAFENGDGPRVVAFFKGYLKDRNLVTPEQTQEPASLTDNSRAERTGSGLEQFAGPGKTNGSAVTVQQDANREQTHTWSRADIARFYKDVQTGRYRNKPDEQARIERSIFEAQKAGTVF